jgi:hypothetical protein
VFVCSRRRALLLDSKLSSGFANGKLDPVPAVVSDMRLASVIVLAADSNGTFAGCYGRGDPFGQSKVHQLGAVLLGMMFPGLRQCLLQR